MYKKLQNRFMLVSTLVLFLVIVLVECAVYWISSGVIASQTKLMIEGLLDNGGDLPSGIEFSTSQQAFLAVNSETIQETRFFSTRVTDGETEIVAMRIMDISRADAVSLTEEALSRSRSFGKVRLGNRRTLHYGMQTEGEGVLVVFVDYASRAGLIRLVMIYTAAVWFLILVLYVLIMGRYSGKLVRPFVENDERQKRFITNASHELKTPLAVISANTEMTEAMGGKTKWTESTRRQTARLQSLIEDLVVLSRLDEMKEIQSEDLDFSAIVGETAESFRGVAEQSGKQFMLSAEPDVHVQGDRRSLQQLTTILLDNATKYCDEGGTITVSLTRRGKNKGAALSVSNTYAEGKDVDYTRFFERFYRQDESHNSRKSGFGIGLSMAKEMAERMKGRLKVSYEGDTITFRLEL